jgi:hypothetical protein
MPNDWMNRRDLMQRLNDKSTPLSWRQDVDYISWMILTGLSGIFLILISIKACEIKACEPQPAAAQQPCHACHNHKAQLTAYFRKNGSEQPEVMAHAIITKTSRPTLLAAVAVVESNANPAIRRSGYKRRHDGAFQVNPRHWGRVPADAHGQAAQADRILAELLEDQGGKIVPALNYYGGEKDLKRGKYAFNVLNELKAVP